MKRLASLIVFGALFFSGSANAGGFSYRCDCRGPEADCEDIEVLEIKISPRTVTFQLTDDAGIPETPRPIEAIFDESVNETGIDRRYYFGYAANDPDDSYTKFFVAKPMLHRAATGSAKVVEYSRGRFERTWHYDCWLNR